MGEDSERKRHPPLRIVSERNHDRLGDRLRQGKQKTARMAVEAGIMGILDWLGVRKRRSAPVPAVVLGGTHLGGCKDLIRHVAAGLDPALTISAILYDTHHGIHSFEVPSNVRLLGCVGKDGAVACACHGEGIESVRVGVQTAVRTHDPDVILLQVGRGMSAAEVFGDLKTLASVIRVVNVTTVMRGVSALSDLSNEQSDPASHVRSADCVLLTRAAETSGDIRDTIRKRVAALNPRATIFEDIERSCGVILAALGKTGASDAGHAD